MQVPYFIYGELVAITEVRFYFVRIRHLRPKLVITAELQTFEYNVLAPIVQLRVQPCHHVLPCLFGWLIHRLNIFYFKLLFAQSTGKGIFLLLVLAT